MIKRILCGLLVVVCLFFAVSCDQVDFPVRVGDTTVEALPTRVVSLSPMTTEMLHAIGASAHLVGRSEGCQRPASVQELPSMGTALNPDIDAILATEATLVLTTSPMRSDDFERLKLQGVAVLCLSAAESLEEVKGSYEALATAMGGGIHGPENGRRAYTMLEDRLKSVTQAVAGKESFSACYVGSLSAVAPENSLPGALLRTLGLKNSVAGQEWQAAIPKETQVIFCDASLVEQIRTHADYTECEAVKQGRVLGVDAGLWECQGLGMAEAALQMASSLYPDVVLPDWAAAE